MFEIIDLLFQGFTAYCLYQLAILPMLKEKQEKLNRLSAYYDEQIKKLEKQNND
jgi:hypothetical protein